MNKHIGRVAVALGAVMVLALSFALACNSGDSGGGDNPTPAGVSVTVSPKTVALALGGTQTFTATVTGDTSGITAATWTASGGTITQGGAYTAPAAAGTFTVKATSQADAAKSDTATVTVTGGSDPPASGWAAVSAGVGHSLGLKPDGGLWAWGSNDDCQLGLGDTDNRNVPTRVGADSWKAVSAGSRNSLAIMTDGSLWAWGCNFDGQLGLGDTADRNVPTRVGTGNNWATVSTCRSHTLAVKTDGSLWAWGTNGHGQLGLGNGGPIVGVDAPTRVGTDTNWATVSAGVSHSLAVKTDGTLWAWGSNENGKLGLGNTSFLVGMNVPTRAGAASNWAEVKAGGRHSLAIRTDGSLWAWGYNQYGQLGLGDANDRNAPTRVGTDSWKDAAAGIYSDAHTLAVKADGSLWAWGQNRYSQLGLGASDDNAHPTPTRVGTDTNWAAASAGGYYSHAIKTDGGLWAWGNNWFGQLGLGDTTQRNTPTRVGGPNGQAAAPADGDE